MAFSLKLTLRPDKCRTSDGTAPIVLRVTAGRRSRQSSTGVRVQPKHWNEAKQQVRRGHPTHAALNARLEAALAEAHTRLADAQTNSDALQSLKTDRGSFSDFFRHHIAGLEKQSSLWEVRKYTTTLGKLEAAMGGAVRFDDLTPRTLRTFETYLSTKAGPDGTGNSPNTVHKEMARLKTVVRKAVREEVTASNPFERYQLPKKQSVEKRKLTIDEIRALESVQADSGSRSEHVRDAFLLAFYAGGMRFGDTCVLSSSNLDLTGDGLRLRYRMMKSGKMIDIALPPAAQSILERYDAFSSPESSSPVLPFLDAYDTRDPVRLRKRISSCNAYANKILKQLGREAGISRPNELSFHVARHSFADYARRKSGGNVGALQMVLGHANASITQQYLRSLDVGVTDDMLSQVWG